MLAVLIILGTALLLYLSVIKPFLYWKKKNVQTGPTIPVFGDSFNMMMGRENIVGMFQRLYTASPNARYLGFYQFTMPSLMLRTPDLIKQICIKDFDHFLNRRSFDFKNSDDILSKNLISLKGLAWKEMRSNISPSFTSSKMRLMYTLICQNADLFIQYYLKKKENIVEVELKDAFTRYSNDIIASVAFGLQVDSLEDRTNAFYEMGRKGSDFNSLRSKLLFLLFQSFPALASKLKIPFVKQDVQNFFLKIVKDTIQMREEQHIKRPDMLGLLIEARKEQQLENTADCQVDSGFAAVEEHLEMKKTKIDLSDADIAAQLFVFFIAGFEAVSTAMCFLAYELAVNPEIQKRLIDEIDENRPTNGKPSYETIANMTYLDMVVTESLRKWPVAAVTDRLVSKPYTIQPQLPGEKPVHLDLNDFVVIPIYSIHHDAKYYENPEKFDPERFSPENRKNIDVYTYLPFGVGPRNCVGSRFALLEMKAVFFSLLSKFEIVPVEKTNIPIKLDHSALNFKSVNGFPLGLKKRFQ